MEENLLYASASEDCSPLHGARHVPSIHALFGACRRTLSFAPFKALRYEEEHTLPLSGPGPIQPTRCMMIHAYSDEPQMTALQLLVSMWASLET